MSAGSDALQEIADRMVRDFPDLPTETVTAALMAATAVVGERDDVDTALAAVEAAARSELSLMQADENNRPPAAV